MLDLRKEQTVETSVRTRLTPPPWESERTANSGEPLSISRAGASLLSIEYGALVFNTIIALSLVVFYLARPASVLTFSLYYPVVRKIGPAKAAYSREIIPIIAMAF